MTFIAFIAFMVFIAFIALLSLLRHLKICSFLSDPHHRCTWRFDSFFHILQSYHGHDSVCPSIWANYNNSLTWIKAIWGWFPLLTMIPVRSQWGRYNLPRLLFYPHYQHLPLTSSDVAVMPSSRRHPVCRTRLVDKMSKARRNLIPDPSLPFGIYLNKQINIEFTFFCDLLNIDLGYHLVCYSLLPKKRASHWVEAMDQNH